jgi:nucleoside-diphosphate-sugar epimerase
MLKFIFFGAGYCSNYIIPMLPKNYEIICTHNLKIKNNSDDHKYNIKRFCFNDFLKNKERLLKGTSFILNSIPPTEGGDIVINNLKNDIFKNKEKLKWFGYFSSTSVYGNYDGRWVDENSRLLPKTSRGILRKKTETSYLDLFKLFGLPIHIFRLPGIYGPDRSVFDKIQNGELTEIIKKDHFFSRVYVEDIGSAICKSMNKPTPGEVFNLCDDMPCQSFEIIRYAASLKKISKIKTLSYDDPKLNEKVRSFYFDNKRVRNLKIKKILDWTPKYGNYKLGLKRILET